MSWLSKKLIVIFAIIAIILITIISIVMEFDPLTILKRVVLGALVFAFIGGVLGEIIIQNIDFDNSKTTLNNNYPPSQADNQEQGQNQNSSPKDNSEMEPLQFAKLDDEADNVINEIDNPEKSAEVIREMSKDN